MTDVSDVVSISANSIIVNVCDVDINGRHVFLTVMLVSEFCCKLNKDTTYKV